MGYRYQKAVLLLGLALGMGFKAYAASTEIGLNLDWKYADISSVNTGKAILYTTEAPEPRGITVAINIDSDGGTEMELEMELAKIFRNNLLREGYDVLMLRDDGSDGSDALDNIARTVIGNNKADCHISLQWNPEDSGKGAFYLSMPDNFKAKVPVEALWKKHEKLGKSLIEGLREEGVSIFSQGAVKEELSQMAYSTIPFVNIELNDKAADQSNEALGIVAKGLVEGVNLYYNFT